jgi:hypothetical protein
MSASHTSACHTSVSISSFVGDGLPSATEPAAKPPKETIKQKFLWIAFFVGFLQILGLIVATSLYYSENEPAAIVVLCGGYFSRYFLLSIAEFINGVPPNAEIELRFAWLQRHFDLTKNFLMMQLLCIYLQRAIVPDLWLFTITFVCFIIETGKFMRCCFKYHDLKEKKGLLGIIIICAICCGITQLVFFGIFARIYATTTYVQSILKIGALFVPIFFGQIADIVMIVMTKNWEVPAEASIEGL